MEHNNQRNLTTIIQDALFNETDINLTYNNHIVEFVKEINNAYFFSQNYLKKYHNNFKGNLDGFRFALGDIDISIQNQGIKRIFRGSVGYIKINFKLPLVIIVPKNEQNTLDEIVKKFDNTNSQNPNLKKLCFEDNPKFEKYFIAWTNDENKAKKLISAQLRNFLTQKTSIYPIYLTINDEHIYFAVNFSRYCFTINMAKKFTEETFDTMKNDLTFYYYTLRAVKNYILSKL